MIDWVGLFKDIGFDDYYPLNGKRSKRTRANWLQLTCAKCNSSGDLLGIPENGYSGSCFFCGKQSAQEIVRGLKDCSWGEAYDVCNRHKLSASYELKDVEKRSVIKRKNKSLTLPTHTKIKTSGADYLTQRGFDVGRLIKEAHIVQGAINTPFAHRIIFPIYFEGQLVSYSGRSIKKDEKNKYKVCHTDEEVANPKEILYGYDWCKGDSVFVVEGILDCLKFKAGSCVATFGVAFSDSQLNLLKKFKRVFIMYDGEAKAIKQAKLLANGLALHGIDVSVLTLGGDRDPGDLTYEEIEEIVNQCAI